MATLKAVIKSKSRRKDGTWDIAVRLTHNSAKRFIPTSVYVSKKDIASFFRIKNAQIFERCGMLIAEYRKQLSELDLGLNDFPIDAIVKQLKGKKSGEDVSFTNSVNLWLERNASKKGLRNYETSINSFKWFVRHESISCKELNVKMLKSFETSLRNRPRTQSLCINSLKTLFVATKEYYSDEDNDIIIVKHSLEGYKTVPQNIVRKRALTVDEMRSIFSLSCDNVEAYGYSSRHDLTLDCFKLSFCLLGMNSADLFNAKDFDGKTITCSRTKAKGRGNDNTIMQADVHPIIAPPVGKYRDKERIFNFHERFSSMASLNRNINTGLREVGKEARIDNLQFYAARHSMATIAANDVGISKYVVSDILSRTGQALRTTELYIEKNFKAINEANKKLLEYTFDKDVQQTPFQINNLHEHPILFLIFVYSFKSQISMEKVIDTIRNIKTVRIELQKAIRNDKLATSPQVADLSFIEKIYNAFLEDKGEYITVNDHKVFIFVVIYLYAPQKLLGDKMPHGMRKAITNVAGIICASFISPACAELLTLYTTYDDFQQEVDRFLNKVYSII